MDKASREKIALVVFVLLVVLAGAALIGYFNTGRTWNVAASFVDDTVGRMDGYTVLVYAGTVDPEDEAQDTADEAPDAGAAGEPQDSPEAAGGEAGAPDAGEGGSAPGAVREPDPATNSIGLAILPFLSSGNRDQDESGAVFVSDVRSMYEQKDAAVLSLDIGDLARYEQPQVLMARDRSIGVYSVDFYATRALLARYEEDLRAEGADLVVCLATRESCLASFDYADVVVVTEPTSSLSTLGTDRGDAFVVASPERGSVGVVVVTATNVRSARVIDALEP
ncbi:MAG: hypothetical protein HFJ75_08605 [Eggerthellaceae bacterium]|nr:hypothetical protein [Eggerthellaceae bacterium]